MKTLSKEEYADLYNLCKEMNMKHVRSLKKINIFLMAWALFMGFMAYISYSSGIGIWKMFIFFAVMAVCIIIFLFFFYMPTRWLKRRVKHFPGMTYQELKEELDSYL